MTRTGLRQVLLCLVGAVFLAEAVAALWDPRAAAARVGYQIAGADGRKVCEPLLADVIRVAIVAEAAARCVGLALDGAPGTVHMANIAMESFPIAILLLRPTAVPEPSAVPRDGVPSRRREAIMATRPR
jgi:hypothetical protein